jgi:hypothetical protein
VALLGAIIDQGAEMTRRESAFERWGLLAGPAFVVVMVVGFVVSGSSPDPDSRTAKIVSYLGSSSQYHKNIAGALLILLAGLLLITFVAAVRSVVHEAEGPSGWLAALALGAGAASTVLLILAILLFTVPAISAHDAAKHGATLEPSIYRFSQDLGYMSWVASTVLGAALVWAVAAAALRTGLLPRWFAWVSIVVGVICLAAVLFFPIMLFYLWILIAGLLLLRHRRRFSTTTPVTATT